MWWDDVASYRVLHAQLPFVMVAHASYPAITKDKLPASLSPKWIRDILRKKIGYKGLIITDDLEMGGVLAAGSIEDVTVATLRAGADMFLVGHNSELIQRAYEAVLREAERALRFALLVARAPRPVSNFKHPSPDLLSCSTPP